MDPDRIDFGPVRIGEAVVDTVRVTNGDANDLLITSANVPPPAFDLPASPFSGDILLAPGAGLDVALRFSPHDSATFSTNLQFHTVRGSFDVQLEGEGVPEVIVINEILADPASGGAGDANGDGTRHSSEDEFVEILNIGLRSVSLAGSQLSDAGTGEAARFTFPPGAVLAAGSRAVLFGGGSPSGVPGAVFADDGKIGRGLTNSGDTVYLIDPVGPDTLARAVFGSEGGKNQSLVREPDGRGAFVLHESFPGNGEAHSPGRERIHLVGVAPGLADTTIQLGAQLSGSAVGIFSDSSSILIDVDELVWTSSDPTVVAVEAHVLRGVGIGTSTISAVAGGVASSGIRIDVEAPGIGSLRIAPSDTLVVTGDTSSFVAIATLSNGVEETLQSGVTWGSQNGSIAHHLGSGRFASPSHGSATLTAAVDDVSTVASLLSGRRGDLDADGAFALVDALRLVYLILGDPATSSFESRSSDLNSDGSTDIVDLTILINHVLGIPAAKPTDISTVASYRITGGLLVVEANTNLRALMNRPG
jgi:hypothetical protein